MDFLTDITQHRTVINDRLKQLFATKYKSASPAFKPFVRRIEKFTLNGGKRLRAYLVSLGAAFVGGKVDSQVLEDLGVVLELGHTGILIHDDIIDRDLLRRGQPTLHLDVPTWHPNKLRDKQTIGYLTAITAGNLLGAWSHEIILQTKLAPERKVLLLEVLTRTGLLTAHGEVYDIQMGTGQPPSIHWQELMAIQQLKTAPYSFEGPLVFGALAAGGSQATLKALREYSSLVGTAFQLQDDLLGLRDEAEVGKTPAADLREGKFTPLIKAALQKSSPTEQRHLRSLLAKPFRTARNIKTMKSIIAKSNAIELIAEVAGTKVKLADTWTQKNITDTATQDLFRAVAHFVLNRKY